VSPDPALLRCPHCHGALRRDDRVWRCADEHAFDVARQGYVNLTAGRQVHPGDTAAMLDARAAILSAGHLDVVTDAVVAALRCGPATGALVEVGAGTAHHLVRARRALGERPAIALDASVAAAKRAARADPGWTTAVVADAWAPWPLVDRVAAAVLTIFAPRNWPEAARVLVPAGQVVAVTPDPAHLGELVGPLGLVGIEPGKDERLREDAAAHGLDVLGVDDARAVASVSREEAVAMAAMGPSGHAVGADVIRARAADLPAVLPVTVAVRVTRLGRRA
jgi:23S rRNA (guanine745-N1)-methyltransferase